MSKINDWGLLKLQFDALTHDENVEAGSIEEVFDIEFRRQRSATRSAIITGRGAKDPRLESPAQQWNFVFARSFSER
jgi:hypothetical protein